MVSWVIMFALVTWATPYINTFLRDNTSIYQTIAVYLSLIHISVGMAAVGKYDKKDYRVYTLCGDGEIQEGQIWEAAMWAGFKLSLIHI